MDLRRALKEKKQDLAQLREIRSRDEAARSNRRAASERVQVMEKVLSEIREKIKKETNPRKREILEAKAQDLRACLEGEKRNVIGTNYRTAIGRQPA